MNKAVFLDRDGVINDGTQYYTFRPQDFKLNPGVANGLKMLQKAGFLLIVVTNQGGVAKGIYTEKDVEDTHAYMQSLLSNAGISIDAIFYCPHHSDITECNCRKPKPGMILEAIKQFCISPKLSFLIGDSNRDIEAAKAAGVAGIKIEKNENIVPYCQKIATACIANMQ